MHSRRQHRPDEGQGRFRGGVNGESRFVGAGERHPPAPLVVPGRDGHAELTVSTARTMPAEGGHG
ncbi:hypothetical protein ACFXGT_32065 [Streptomyces sp. NPDC059352]|uniref:hypothetical protein n=1 Tax=Streptomyces sp. NPDC059352 TaxID=3346810 RepID=UPI00368F05C9